MFVLLSLPDPRISDPRSYQAFPTSHRLDVPFSSPLNDRYGTSHHTPMYPSPNMHSNPNGGNTMAADLPQPTMAPPEFSAHVPLVVKLEHGVFVHHGPAEPSNGLGMGGGSMQPPVVTEMATMVPSAASVAPVAPNPGAAPMEAMSGVQNQEEGQAVPPYKYDLLNSLPCEWSSTYAVLRRALCTMAVRHFCSSSLHVIQKSIHCNSPTIKTGRQLYLVLQYSHSKQLPPIDSFNGL